MTAEELSRKLNRTPVWSDQLDAARIKVAFLLNLIGGHAFNTFTDEELRNARDALMFMGHRAVVDALLDLRPQEGEERAGPHAPTVMPLALMADENKDITRRVVAFLRPDPKMLIEVEKKEIPTDPHIDVFQVTIEDGRGGSWCEAYGTEDQLRAFLRGIRVTYAMSDLQRLLPDFGDDAPLAFAEQSAVQHLP